MKTPLHEIHRTQGARFTEYQGWELPDQFTNPLDEYWAVRTAVGLVDVSHRTTLSISGPDRQDWLHRLLTNDIKSLRPGQGCQAALLTPQGKLISIMNVLATEDTMLLETEPVARATLMDRLQMYQLTQRVELRDVTGEVVKLLIQGPKAVEFLRGLIHHTVTPGVDLQHHESQLRLATDEHGMPEVGKGSAREGTSEWMDEQAAPPRSCTPTLLHSIRLVRLCETGEEGYELIAPAEEAPEVWQWLLQASPETLRPVGLRAFNILRVEAGRPWYGVDMDDTNFPQEARLDHILDWNKGCYVGQEPVARIRYRGHVNKKLAGLKFSGTIQPQSGDSINKDGREIGHVTSAVFSPLLNCPIALGYVRREFLDPGTELVVETAQGPTMAVVAELPFFVRGMGW